MIRRIILGVLLSIFFIGAAFAADQDDEKIYPGNLLSITLFGNKEVSKDYRVDPQGFIVFPEVGQISCTNQTVSSLRDLAIKKLSTIYRNASTLTIAKKSNDIYINVLGLVKSPGYYLVPIEASIDVALQKAGGLSEGAQMNKIQLRRAGKVTEIDYRKYLDDGDLSQLPKLMASDEVFVPSSKLISNINLANPVMGQTANKNSTWLDTPSDQSVKIMGGINRPGRYAWSNEMNVLDLIAEAGGATRDADTENINIVTNATANEPSQTIKFNLARFMDQGGNINSLPVIKAGYTINIPQHVEVRTDDKTVWTQADPKTVIYVFGEVKKPGRYHFDNKLNFLDILSAADGPTEKADLRDVHLIDRQGVYPQVVHVNLSLYFDTGDSELIPPVLTGDAIYVPKVDKDYTEVNSKHVVKVLGEVAKPGRYRFTSNMTILDLLSAAGGPTSAAWVKKILIVNIGPNLETKTTTFDMMKFSRTGDLRTLPALREGDVVYVPNNQEDDKKRFADTLQMLANIALLISYGRNLH